MLLWTNFKILPIPAVFDKNGIAQYLQNYKCYDVDQGYFNPICPGVYLSDLSDHAPEGREHSDPPPPPPSTKS